MCAHELRLVPNAPEYFEFMRLLRNDDRVQSGFIEQVNITPEQQIEYMEKYGDRYYICLCGERPAGYIGAIDGDIRIATHPDFQKKGIGLFMLDRFLQNHKDCFARIKPANTASLNLFRRAGFEDYLIILRPSGA